LTVTLVVLLARPCVSSYCAQLLPWPVPTRAEEGRIMPETKPPPSVLPGICSAPHRSYRIQLSRAQAKIFIESLPKLPAFIWLPII